MEPKISVIIPCYNSEKFIMRCANSLFNQTIGIENLELIFVNDASTDNTLSILSGIEKKYPDNIIVVNLSENKKQGTARNIGLQYATAEYIGFVDSDDWIDENMFRKLYIKAKQYDCDVVGCYLKIIPQNNLFSNKIGDELYLTINTVEDRKLLFNSDIAGGITTNIYRKSLIIDNQIFFPEQVAYEDNYWYAMLRLSIHSIYKIPEEMYYYCLNPDSTLQSINANHHFDRLKIEVMKLEEYRKKGVLDIYRDEIEIEFLNLFYINTLHIFFTKFTTVPVKIIELMKKIVIKEFPNYKENYYFVHSKSFFDPILNTLDVTWDETQWNAFAEKYRTIQNIT